jgi:hypothetical protein
MLVAVQQGGTASRGKRRNASKAMLLCGALPPVVTLLLTWAAPPGPALDPVCLNHPLCGMLCSDGNPFVGMPQQYPTPRTPAFSPQPIGPPISQQCHSLPSQPAPAANFRPVVHLIEGMVSQATPPFNRHQLNPNPATEPTPT